ncbi:MAG: hypothetical protein COB02_11745 [Candidatus Cloacimonadota bacterium]|nr:MAG: hypothetical protein COB02_11745 [Candidatus Cloacimonadota bacterium]
MNSELQQLYIEIRNKDWEAELTSFKEELHLEKINEKRFSLDFLIEYKNYFYPIFIAAFLGLFISIQTSFILYMVLLFIICTSILFINKKYTILISSIIATVGGSIFVQLIPTLLSVFVLSKVFGMLVGCGLGSIISIAMIYRSEINLTEIFPLLASYNPIDSLPLKPNDLLRFWESKMGVYIGKKKIDLKDYLRKIYQRKEDLNNLLLELSEYDGKDERQAKKDIQEELDQAINNEEDVQNIIEILSLMEKGFLHKITQLKDVIEQKNLLESKIDKKKTLHLRINQAISSNVFDKKSWEAEKKEMQIELKSIMSIFHDQILQSGDFFQAQLDLVDHKGKFLDE